MNESKNKQDVQYSITKEGEEPNTYGDYHYFGKEIGNNDPLAELEQTYRNIKPRKETRREELNRLYRQLHERDKEFEKAKGKRMIITILCFTAFYFVIIMIASGYTDIITTIEDIFSDKIVGIMMIALASIMIALFHFWVNATIFWQLSEMGRRESDTLEYIRKRIKELEKNLDN